MPQLLTASGHPPSSFSPRHLVTLVTGCRLLRSAPSAGWLLQLLEWTQPRLDALGPLVSVVVGTNDAAASNLLGHPVR